jgi:hypothetical protein
VHAVPGGDKARERLEIHMEELPGPLPLIARPGHLAAGLLETPEPGVMQPAAHGGPRQLKGRGDLRPGEAPTGAQVDHPLERAARRAPGRVVWSGGPVEQPSRSFGEKARAPLVERARADVQGGGHEGDGLPVLEQAADRFGSPPDGQPSILMGVH